MNLSLRVLMCEFAFRKVQMIYIWSSGCHCHPVISCFIKIQMGLTFLVLAYPGCPRKEAVKQASVFWWINVLFIAWMLIVCWQAGHLTCKNLLHLPQRFSFVSTRPTLENTGTEDWLNQNWLCVCWCAKCSSGKLHDSSTVNATS